MARTDHFEMPIDNADRAIAFYSKVLGWKIEKWEVPGLGHLARLKDCEGNILTISVTGSAS